MNRRRIMIAADGFIALATLLLAVLFWTGKVEMWHIFTVLALRSVGTTFHQPAMQASIPLLAPAEEMARIAGVNQAVSAIGSIAGPMLGALLATTWQMEAILLLDIAGAAIAIGSLLFVAIPNPEREGVKLSFWADMKGGVNAVLKNKGLSWALLFTFIAGMFYLPLSTLFPLLTLKHYGGTEMQVSFMQILWGAGFLIGGIAVGLKARKMNRIAVVNLMYIIMGAAFCVMGLLPSEAFGVCLAAAFVGGAAGALYVSLFTSVIQTEVETSALGRVFSMYFTLSIIPCLISLVATGFLADRVGVAGSFVYLGIAMAVVGALAFAPRSSLEIDRQSK